MYAILRAKEHASDSQLSCEAHDRPGQHAARAVVARLWRHGLPQEALQALQILPVHQRAVLVLHHRQVRPAEHVLCNRAHDDDGSVVWARRGTVKADALQLLPPHRPPDAHPSSCLLSRNVEQRRV